MSAPQLLPIPPGPVHKKQAEMPITQFFPVGRNTGVYYIYYVENLNRPIANKVIELAIEKPPNKQVHWGILPNI